MRSIQDINEDEITAVNAILLKSNFRIRIADAFHLYYNVFYGADPLIRGLTVIELYEYLRSVNIDVFIPWDENYKQTAK